VPLVRLDIQETLVALDPLDPLDLLELAVLLAPLDNLVGLATQRSAFPMLMEMVGHPDRPAQMDHLEITDHKETLAIPGLLETRDHPVLQDYLELPETMETLARKVLPAIKEKEVAAPNTAVWMVESSSKMEPESEHNNNNDDKSPSLINTFFYFLFGFNCFFIVLVGSFRNLSKLYTFRVLYSKYLVLLTIYS